jgi:hypothetical protein
MLGPFLYQVAIWLPVLMAFLLSIAHGSGHELTVSIVQGGLFFLAGYNIKRWKQRFNQTALTIWILSIIVSAAFLITVFLSGAFWTFSDLGI